VRTPRLYRLKTPGDINSELAVKYKRHHNWYTFIAVSSYGSRFRIWAYGDGLIKPFLDEVFEVEVDKDV